MRDVEALQQPIQETFTGSTVAWMNEDVVRNRQGNVEKHQKQSVHEMSY
jgi:hypothetical protein